MSEAERILLAAKLAAAEAEAKVLREALGASTGATVTPLRPRKQRQRRDVGPVAPTKGELAAADAQLEDAQVDEYLGRHGRRKEA